MYVYFKTDKRQATLLIEVNEGKQSKQIQLGVLFSPSLSFPQENNNSNELISKPCGIL